MEKSQPYYDSVAKSMMMLALYGTVMDDIISGSLEMRHQTMSQMPPWVLYFLFCLVVLFSSFILLNMLIGVLCEVVNATSADEGQKAHYQELTMAFKELFEKTEESEYPTEFFPTGPRNFEEDPQKDNGGTITL